MLNRQSLRDGIREPEDLLEPGLLLLNVGELLLEVDVLFGDVIPVDVPALDLTQGLDLGDCVVEGGARARLRLISSVLRESSTRLTFNLPSRESGPGFYNNF